MPPPNDEPRMNLNSLEDLPKLTDLAHTTVIAED